VLERASARETAARVAAGAVAKALLGQLDIAVLSHVIQLGPVHAIGVARPEPGRSRAVDASEVRCFDPDVEAEMIREIKEAAKSRRLARRRRRGARLRTPARARFARALGSAPRRLLAQALMSIQAMKAVEIGEGITVSGARGSVAHDAIAWDSTSGEYRRESSRAGGIEGGMSTGDLLVARAVMKPLATLNRPVLKTVDTETKAETVSFKERTDVTAVPAAGVVAETMVALVLANEVMRSSVAIRSPRPCAITTRIARRCDEAFDLDRSDGRGKVVRSDPNARTGSDATSSIPTTSSSRWRGCRSRGFFAAGGEPRLREIERQAVADVCASPVPLVIACGGGTVLDPDNRRCLRDSGVVVWLRVPVEVLAARVGDGASRPLLAGDPRGALARLAAAREAAYEATAQVVVDGDDSVDTVANRVLGEFEQALAS
jgi:shikimate kinase